jgi:nucleoid DNA-binding protein
MKNLIPGSKCAQQIASVTGVSRNQVMAFLRVLTDVVADALRKGKTVRIPGLADFSDPGAKAGQTLMGPELAHKIAVEMGVSRSEALRLIRAMAQTVFDALKHGKSIRVPYLSWFGVQERGKPVKLPKPRSAWLLLGDDASFVSREDIKKAIEEESELWTCSPHVEKGDTLFIYYIAPRKAIHFIARAEDTPFFDPTLGVNAKTRVNPHQWWVPCSSMIEVQPITFEEICEAAGARLIPRGRSGKYLRPEVANRLLEKASVAYSPAKWCEKVALQKVVGPSILPDPRSLSLKELTEIPSGLLRVEAEVERHVVEPILRMTKVTAKRAEILKQYNLPGGIVDYAIRMKGDISCVIEVKLRTEQDSSGNWKASPDYKQAVGYAGKLRCRFMLIDCEDIFCFDADRAHPTLSFNRHELTQRDLVAIRRHLMNS